MTQPYPDWIEQIGERLGPTISHEDAQRLAAHMFDALRRHLSEEQSARVFERLWPIWRSVFLPELGERRTGGLS